MGKTKIVLNQQSDLILNNAQILQPTGIVKSDLPGLVEDIAGITMSIAAEATARTAADIKLTDDLAAETSARIADVDAEEARAIAAETKLTSDLSSEVSRATAAENQLSSDLADETAARIADVDAEETRALAAEAQLTSDLASEVSRALAAEGVLQSNIDVEKGRIDAILQGSDVNLDQFKEVVDFVNSIDMANDDALLTAVTNINADLATETADRIADVDAEEARALAAEAALQSAIDAESAARIAADAGLDSRINDIISNTNAPIIDSFSEVVAQMEAMPGIDDTSIFVDSQNNISLKDTIAAGSQGVRTFEGLVNVGSEPSLDENFTDLSLVTKGYVTGVSTEIATNLDNLQTYVNTTVDSAIATLTTDIDNEEAARIAADNQLQANIDAINTDITGTVNNESAARIQGDAYLQSEIDALALTDGETIDVNYAANTIRLKEVVAAPDSGVRTFEGDIKVGQQPDTLPSYNDSSLITKGILDSRVSSEVSTLNTTISDEVSRAQNAEAQLQSNIDTERERIDAILLASDADKDSFAEIVQLINSVDTENDQAFASYVLSNDARLTAEEQERLRLTNLLGEGLITEQIAREDGDAALQHEFDILPMTDGETIELNYVDNTIRLKEFVNMPDSGVRVFEGDLKADSQPENRGTFNELSYVTKNYVDNKVYNDLSDAVTQEMAERIAADAALTELIDVKKSEAITSSNQYTDAETQRALSAEGYLQSSIDALALTDGDTIDVNYASNTIRLKEVVAAPDSGVRTFEGDIKVGEQPNILPTYNDFSLITKGIMDTRLSEEVGNINTSISDEISRAQNAEAQLQSNIDTERSRIDAILMASDADKDSFAEIVNLINSVDTENDQAFASYVLSNDAALAAEVAERLRLTNLLGDGIVNEQIAREDADAAIHNELNNLPMTDGETIDVNYVDNTIKLKDIVAAPTSGYRVFEGDLKLNAQPDTNPNFNDLSLITKYYVDNKVSIDLTNAISQEEADRIAADAGLMSDLAAEVSRAQSVEASLQSAIDAEAAARIAADEGLDARINDIVSNSNAPIIDSFTEVVASLDDLRSDLTIETDDRIAADAQLSSDLANLQSYVDTTVDSAIATLTSDLADETAARIADVDAEEARAIAAEAALDAAKLNLAGGTMSGTIYMDGNIIEMQGGYIGNTTQLNVSVLESYVRTTEDNVILTDIYVASDLNFDSGASITNLVTPTNGGDATNKTYVDAGDAALAADLADLQSYVDTTVDSAIATLTSDLATETAARIADVDAEEARAMAAEGVLQSNIDIEKGRIDAILLASDADKDSFAEIVNLINSVDTENDQAFASYVLSNNVAISSLSSTFSAALAAEESARIAADAQLSSDLADLQSYVDTTVDSAIATLTSDLADETAARIADVDAEEARAMAAEAVLQTNINTEANERMAEDITLQGNIDIESNRAQAAETAIASDLADETAARIADVDAEETRAMLAEAALAATFSTAISNEEARAMAAEGVLQSNIDVEKGRIDAILLASDADKDSFAEIVALINSVDTTNDQAFASYVLSNDAALAAEVLRAETAEASLSATFSAAISAEEARATAAELVLTNDLASEVSRANAAEASLTSALSAEEASRIAGDSALQSSLNNEIADRIAAGQAAQTALDSETTRAMAAEATLTSDLASEVSRALAAEASLSATFSAALAAETFRAQAAEIQLSNDLSDEASYRIDADTLLQSNIDTEKARIDAILLASDADKDSFAEIVSLINSVDTTNDTAFASYVLSNDAALASEVSRALAAEASLSATFSAAISAETAARIADVDAEETRALAAEAALAADFANIYCKKVAVTGTPNGVLTSFSLASPVRLGSEMIYLNGLLMEEGEDYTTVITSGKVTSVTFSSAPTSVMKVVAYGVY